MIKKILLIFLLLSFCSTSHAYEDFTDAGTWTVVDEDSDYTVTATKVLTDTMREDANSVVYGDYGASYFQYFVHEYEVYTDTCSADSARMGGVIYSNTAASTQRDQIDNSDGWGIRHYCYGADQYVISILDYEEGAIYLDILGVVVDTLYYVRVKNTSGYRMFELFTDSNRTTLLGAIFYPGEPEAFRYVNVASSDDDGAGVDTYTGYVQNLNLSASPSNYVWGGALTRGESPGTGTIARCMGGTSPATADMKLEGATAFLGRDAGGLEARLAVYQGGSLTTGPNGATLKKDFGKIATVDADSWYTAYTTDDIDLAASTVTWVCYKSDEGVEYQFDNDDAIAGDFQTARGRWDSDCESTDSDDGWDSPFCTDGGSGAFTNYWYNLDLIYSIADVSEGYLMLIN